MANRRNFCLGLAAAPLLATRPETALAQDKRQLSMVIPYTPGGSTDLLGRMFADALSGQLGEKIIVENRPGANGTLGVAQVAAAAADGRTLLYTFGNLMLNQEFMMKDLRLRALESLVPVARTCIVQAVIVAGVNFQANDLREFIAMAKRSPAKHTYGYYGDLGIAAVAAEAGIDLLRVPYKGGMPGMVDVAAGVVDIITSSVAQAGPMLRGGKLKALAVTGDQRLAEWPNVPTVKEILPNYRALDYQVVMVPTATPRPMIDQLWQHMNAVLANADFRRSFMERGALVSNLRPDELRAFMDEDRAAISKAMKAARIEPE
jgi:tripartite-type tricarboxylate transporter receptor subunit TctC